MSAPISNCSDIIDSRDVTERIEWLESVCLPVLNTETGEDELDPSFSDEEREDLAEELRTLKPLAEEASTYAADWHYGEALIRDSYFEDYARELAEDCGMVKDDASWPNNCIDWEEAARQLRQNYTAVEFDGVTYWIG